MKLSTDFSEATLTASPKDPTHKIKKIFTTVTLAM